MVSQGKIRSKIVLNGGSTNRLSFITGRSGWPTYEIGVCLQFRRGVSQEFRRGTSQAPAPYRKKSLSAAEISLTRLCQGASGSRTNVMFWPSIVK